MGLSLGRRARAGERGVKIGDNITLRVTRVSGGKVRLWFDAPREISIVREELISDTRKKAEHPAT